MEKDNTPVKLERSHQENIYKTIVSIALEITPKVYKSNFKNMVLIEISEVIRLKRGVSNVIKKIKQELKKKLIKNKGFDYYDFKIAASRNPWISECICLDLKRNTFTKILDEKKMIKKLQSLPVKMICESNETLVSLERLGIENIGQILKLPKKGLRHRFGTNLIEKINQITSNNEITLKKIITPICVEKRKEFLCSILDKKTLLREIEKLLKILCLKLNEYYLETSQIRITIFNDSRKNSSLSIEINLSGTTKDPKKLFLLAKEKIEHSEFPESIKEIKLHFSKIIKVFRKNNELFFKKNNSSSDISDFIDVVSSRLKPSSIIFFKNRSNHAPEQKFNMYSLADINGLTTLHNRGKETEPGVIWLYEEPILLEERYKKPYYKGILEIHNSLERIETNWWTANPVKRDYYIADTIACERLWIYLTPEKNWYLHGKFW